jgi:hypothetical protein
MVFLRGYRGECVCGYLHRGLQTQEPETVVLLSICESHVSEDHHEENNVETAAVGFDFWIYQESADAATVI